MDKLSISQNSDIIAKMERLKVSLPQVVEEELNVDIHNNRTWTMGGEWNEADINFANRVVGCAQQVFAEYLPRENKTGAILGISKREENAGVLYVKIGEIDKTDDEYQGGKNSKYVDFLEAKVMDLQKNKNSTRSSENEKRGPESKTKTRMTKKEISGGAVAFDFKIIGVSGLSSDAKIDEEAILEIGSRLGLEEGYHTGVHRATIRHPKTTF